MNSELWHRLQSYHPDAGGSFPFSKRLAMENNWTTEFALEAIDEYKKFIYLCCEAGHLVTPSKVVDQVWHLHLIYTESYWQDLCAKVLHREIHHGPTRGGKQEDLKYKEAYTKTLESYRLHFQIEPPADFWESPETRFRPSRQQWIDTRQYLLIPATGGFRTFIAQLLRLSIHYFRTGFRQH